MTGYAKPIVFFSHASEDSRALERLKDILIEKTGGAIEVFLSGDGQSIPFGRNWVATLETALDAAKLAFCFLSQKSASSRWVHFEAGFMYAKGVRVVPVGFLGFDLLHMAPPLSLLQGFNVHDASTLNNLIALINEELELRFPAFFSDEDYKTIVGTAAGEDLGLPDFIARSLQRIEIDLSEVGDTELVRTCIAELIRDLDTIDAENLHDRTDGIILPGLKIAVLELEARRLPDESGAPVLRRWLAGETAQGSPVCLRFDEHCPESSLGLADRLLGMLRARTTAEPKPKLEIVAHLDHTVAMLAEPHEIFARLVDAPGFRYRGRGIHFEGHSASLVGHPRQDAAAEASRPPRMTEARVMEDLGSRYSTADYAVQASLLVGNGPIPLGSLRRYLVRLFERQVLRHRVPTRVGFERL